MIYFSQGPRRAHSSLGGTACLYRDVCRFLVAGWENEKRAAQKEEISPLTSNWQSAFRTLYGRAAARLHKFPDQKPAFGPVGSELRTKLLRTVFLIHLDIPG